MIIIKTKKDKNMLKHQPAKYFMADNWKKECSTFYGKVGDGPDGYYLITFNAIVSLENPRNTWTGNPLVEIYRWVDLEMEEV